MKTLEISSPDNSQFKMFKSLLTAKGIKENLMFFLMGQKLVQEFIKNPVKNFKIQYLLSTSPVDLNVDAKKTILTPELFKELDVIGTNEPLLVLSYEKFPVKNLDEPPQALELICPLGDPRNLGALIRSAVGFDARQIILTPESAHPFLPHSLKASAGAALQISFLTTPHRLNQIPMHETDFALELHGTPLTKVKWPESLRLWVGEEGPGLILSEAQKKVMQFIHIPTSKIESLNATVSTSLALWDYKTRKTTFST